VLFPRRPFLDEAADAVDDVARAMALLNDRHERLAHLLPIRRLKIQKAQSGLGVGHHRGDGLLHFMADRCGQLSHGCHAVGMRQLLLAVA